ncbi:adaptor protein MecA [Enterococcus timonensis]|uniref:adaptor protein MecA n=1 Tax=Enterococcus timonensis TaxID=1852364 RepID=UPI0008D9C047|nr:adaptor protein MecA [Enterococcus timonensis]
MDMERLNENTIRVMIRNEDLEARGITLRDLMKNQQDTENFFYSILEEVDQEAQFEDSDSVTFQVLPNRNGLEVLISKDLDLPDDFPFMNVEPAKDFDAADFQSFLQDKMGDMTDFDDDQEDDLLFSNVDQAANIFKLNSFEEMISLAQNVELEHGLTNLYLLEDIYYLELVDTPDDASDFERKVDRALLLEYAHETDVTGAYLHEHGTCVMERSAIELTRYYFHE